MLGQTPWLQKVRKQSSTEGIGLALVGAQTSHPKQQTEEIIWTNTRGDETA